LPDVERIHLFDEESGKRLSEFDSKNT
jgi:hypothetical protein